ncbi:MAG TPA: tRNA threonylcarbamoyladenosine dehydratase [Candidatus Hydrogenedens sp.]|nr:tRNA threonylcarbamoyladenosine dehydratase [Candidatus Hydrogenedens sp.]
MDNTEKPLYERTLLLLGKEKLKELRSAHVAVFGLGGVGSYALEALVRAGVGTITIVDSDCVEESNINRQLLANYLTVGKYKIDIAEERIHSINPSIVIHKFGLFVNKENLPEILKIGFHFAIDAIDSVESKIDLLTELYHNKIDTVSCMGAGMKLDPSCIKVSDISKTHTCPLAKIIRAELRERGIKNGITCVFSTEPPLQKQIISITNQYMPSNIYLNKRSIGSISYIPGIIGLTAAGILIQYIINS